MTGNAKAAEQLAEMRAAYGTEPRLGCDLAAHRDLGFCAHCPVGSVRIEVTGWRLLALAERGVPDQPSRS